MGVSRADNSVQFDEICPLAIPNQISLMSWHIASLIKIPCYLLKLSSGNENMGVPRADNSVKFDEICPLAIPNQISLMSWHIASLIKIPCYLLKLSSGNENMGVSRADNSVQFDEICPLAIPNQISLMSWHIASLIKIPCYSENPMMFIKVIIRKRKTDGRTTDGRTDRHTDVQRETIIPRHYCVAGNNNRNYLGWGGIRN